MKNIKNLVKYACIGLMSFGLLCVAGCAQSQPSHTESDSTNMATKGADIGFDGGRLSYSGNVLTVTVDENQTTGYSWTSKIEGSGLVADGESALNAEGRGANEGEPMVGEGGIHVFSYKGMSPGESTVTLTYSRSWEQNSDSKQLVIQVITGKDGNIDSVKVD